LDFSISCSTVFIVLRLQIDRTWKARCILRVWRPRKTVFVLNIKYLWPNLVGKGEFYQNLEFFTMFNTFFNYFCDYQPWELEKLLLWSKFRVTIRVASQKVIGRKFYVFKKGQFLHRNDRWFFESDVFFRLNKLRAVENLKFWVKMIFSAKFEWINIV